MTSQEYGMTKEAAREPLRSLHVEILPLDEQQISREIGLTAISSAAAGVR